MKTGAVSNFAFLQSLNWPETYGDCVRAESTQSLIRVRRVSTVVERLNTSLTTCMTFYGYRFRIRTIFGSDQRSEV